MIDFDFGIVFFSHAAKETLNVDDVKAAFDRFRWRDWGDVSDRLRERNDECVRDMAQTAGLYSDRNGNGFWIITEPKHEYCHVRLASEPWEER